MKLVVVGAVGLGADFDHVAQPDLPPGTSYVGYRPDVGATYLVAVPDDSPLAASDPRSVALWAEFYGVNPGAWRVG